VAFEHAFHGTPSVGETVEALGVPCVEIDVILVDGDSVALGHRLTGGERVAVYPVFERFDITPLARIRPKPLRNPRFVLGRDLGELASRLRLLGFDALHDRGYSDAELAELSRSGPRILLSRDKTLVERPGVTHAYRVRNIEPDRQLAEVVEALDLVVGGAETPRHADGGGHSPDTELRHTPKRSEGAH
jgi:hypothetical protein